jgi:ATP adenylyltransferase
MDRLWAPWRIKYIKAKRQKKCVFCESIKSKSKNYVISKTKHSISMLNIFPYNNGHVMISPIRHLKELSQLKEVEILDLFRTLDNAKKLLEEVLKPDGYNIGINISREAGAGITGHLHIHLVCRWRGDTNFMPILYDTKVISQSLDELYKRLKYVRSKTAQRIRK